ncbi:MAG: SPOR domain-containing protein [Chitinophagaceae bacterium]|nr:SPOR domain-containing protein [Chitinophagaceae bacterium]
MKLTLVFCFCLLAGKLLAQDDKGVIVHKDSRADLLVKKQIEINELNTRDARRYEQGYRILIISSNDRNQANEAKTKVYKNFPELKAYLSYQAPYYKLKVGNFANTKDAEVYLKKIQLYFPATVYIIRDMIEVNPDKSAELN